MSADFLFIDQTLGYALANRSADMANIRQEIAELAQAAFDIPLPLLRELKDSELADLRNIRACVQPDVAAVKAVRSLGCGSIKISLDYALFPQLPPPVVEALEHARSYGLKVAVHILNSAEYSSARKIHLKKLVKSLSLDTLVFDDRQGDLDPLFTYWTMAELQEAIPCEIEYHGGNTRGLATGNALGAVKSGVRSIAVSVGGIKGFPATEEVLMGIKYLLQLPVNIPVDLANRCSGILQALGHEIPDTKPIIGSNIFAHESGVHVDGISKNSELYEPFAPEAVGLSRKIIIGKHSGTAAIKLKLKELKVNAELVDVAQILEKVRGLALAQKAPISNKQLLELVDEAAL